MHNNIKNCLDNFNINLKSSLQFYLKIFIYADNIQSSLYNLGKWT
jgi:hypothetical protein